MNVREHIISHVRTITPCARAQIFTKIFVVLHYYHMSLSFIFYKGPIICCGDICIFTNDYPVLLLTLPPTTYQILWLLQGRGGRS